MQKYRGTGTSASIPFDFTVAVLPDTQYYSQKFPDTFHAQTAWIAANATREKIVFVSHVGDIVESGGDSRKEWAIASAAMGRLKGKVPFGLVAGNHDADLIGNRSTDYAMFREYCGKRLLGDGPALVALAEDECSSIHKFQAAGVGIMSVHLEPDVRASTIAWALEQLDKYPALPVMLTTHNYLNDVTRSRDKTTSMRLYGNSAEDLFQGFIRKQPRIFCVLGGHQFHAGGEYMQVSKNDAGGSVIELLQDYQARSNGGDGWLRLLRFDIKGKRMVVQTYSPVLKKYETDADSFFVIPLML
ncbi:MAG: metallophosphoesterase [Armatimonadota bacterium]